MNLTYNNLYSPSDLLTFTDIPNILKVSEYISGENAEFHFSWIGDLDYSVTADSQYYVTFLGETVTNVMDYENATNKRFWVSRNNESTAMSFAKALRNCSSLAAAFNIIVDGVDVSLISKTIGSKWSNNADYFQTNIPSADLSASGTDGTAYSVMWNSKIDVDVYSGDSSDASNYLTTLEKSFYGEECAFDMSPILSTFSEYGRTIPYNFVLNMVREDGEAAYLDSVSGYTTIGYHANQSDKYKYVQGVQMLLNNTRGENGSILYVYGDTIPYSVLCGTNVGGWTYTVSLKDSAFNEIYTYSSTSHRTSSNYIIDNNLVIPQTYYDNTYYVDITLANLTYRFNVIKPLKAAENYQRVLWRNEYGGISFFDFTGLRSESDSNDIETYEKNIFDYYDNDEFERKKIYSNDYKKTVTLSSHLMERDGKWIFNSLMRSKKIWTVVNGKTYYIIPTSIEVSEDETYKDIYTAKLSFYYSDI